jgi:HAD superfamily hydrolase (TIGR01450 family)
MTVRGAIIDLDGTVYRGGEVLPGARSGVEILREAGIELLFFSNNPLRDGAEYVSYLQGMGIDARPGEACSSGAVTTAYLADRHAEDSVFLIGAEELREQFERAGLGLTREPADADVLVASWTDSFEFGDMQDALEAFNGATTFLGTDPDRTFPGEDGRIVPGSGAIIGSIEAVVGESPDAILGKPSNVARQIALDRLGTAPEETLVVGDRLDTDLLMGERAGMTTVLVLSGVTDREAIPDSDVAPDHVVDGLGDIGGVLESV